MSNLNIYLFAIVFGIFLTSCNGTGARMLFRNAPNIDDHKLFDNVVLKAADQPYYFSKVKKNISVPDYQKWTLAKKTYNAESFTDFLEESKSTAFIIIQNDSIIYESYHNGFCADSFMQVFSVTKAFTTALVDIAIQEGKIKSVNQKVSDFIPEFKEDGKDEIRIKHLLHMTSGLKFEDNSHFIKLGRMYYNKSVMNYVHKIKMRYEPGTDFAYSSMTSLILGICIENATGQSFTSYLQEKLWTPLGMESDALMNISKRDSIAQCYGGLSPKAIDLAKFGRLFLNKGNWNGQQIITEEWASSVNVRDTTEGRYYGYNNGFWLNTYAAFDHYYKENHDDSIPSPKVFEMTDFAADGYRGQNVYINPEYNMIVIRLGYSSDDILWWKSIPKLCDLLNTKD